MTSRQQTTMISRYRDSEHFSVFKKQDEKPELCLVLRTAKSAVSQFLVDGFYLKLTVN